MKILFVCTGNTCRSPMAEGILRELAKKEGLDIEVESGGIATFNGDRAAENSLRVMEDIGIDIGEHRTLEVNQDLIDEYDLILTMSNSHKDSIIFEYAPDENKVFTLLEFANDSKLDIKDPFGLDYDTYETTRDEIYEAVENLVEKLKSMEAIREKTIGIGSDHGGYELKEEIKEFLDELKIDYKDYGTYDTDSVDYPEYGKKVAHGVMDGEVERGIVICGTGIGISLAANKVKGIRCALCSDTYSARMSRAHNNANMLALGARVLGVDLAREIVRVWLDSEFEGGRHERRVNKIED